ncbi:hypothetical protein BWI15_00535 [Kribbella sp. ALI-6-A]|uniref:hypothetical protein n=1 Tax=Kribbella sp. ALI-6-A TaxID=1933817 RepID=UPI00097BAA02|nr:hypothetical protein [Kribbella sp. ALI-6-A]ONI78400.1 hypothetical protein BWI15_00535 [Kribbella sp. ALI-6-A]
MSDLKNLSWSVQQTVQPPPFEQLERRGVRRRRRRQALAGAGVAAAMVVAVLVTLLPLGEKAGTEQVPPVATVPTAPAPGSIEPLVPPEQSGDSVVRAQDAEVRSMMFATPSRWAAAWASCATAPCQYAAVLSRDGAKVIAPARRAPYATLQVGDEAIAVAGPSGEGFSADDRTWADAVLVRLTSKGKVETPLQYAPPTSTFTAGEILLDRVAVGTTLLVLNVADATLRRLDVAGLDHPRSPVRDETGRWWVVAGDVVSGSRSEIAWTDDGRTWNRTLLDPANPGSRIAVSPDGSTVVASSWVDGATAEAIGTLKMSTDRGSTWTSVADRPWARGGGPVAFNDGTAVMLGVSKQGQTALYRLADGKATQLSPGHPGLEELAGDGKLLYGQVLRGSAVTKVATSVDRGLHWREIEPR